MYTENELEISNKSYTNKDFATIYPELLDLVKKLTNKWDPTTSNESDPGVVLLKIAALIADKNNYNIDKNILEAFPLSVTQRANARKLYDMLGYTMNWYKAADTEISFTYTGSVFKEKDADGNKIFEKITIPQWSMITDDMSSIVYTLTEDVQINQSMHTQLGKAIQGTVHNYDVNGVTDITLDNLDSELRLFFTEKFIAENGIFVSNKGQGKPTKPDFWDKVDNLERENLGRKIFKFGILPNSDTCYIQFPQDIGTLIENGLNIKYIITQGEHGNIKANTLTSLYTSLTPPEFSVVDEFKTQTINEDLTIQNVYSATNGCDPEDLDSAYNNYKKTVGTFNTLVTLNDYENAIYQAKDSFDNNIVSNVVVSDRTCDINNTTNVIQRTTTGSERVSIVKQETQEVTGSDASGDDVKINIQKDAMNAFNIGLYILDGVKNIDNDAAFNKSFAVSNDFEDVESFIRDQKCINHEYIETNPVSPIVYLYKAFYRLQGKVITTYKVTEEQARDIENKIRLALFKKYNARNVNFGQPVNYDDIIKTIQDADTRIKTVVLADPEYFLRYMTSNDNEGTLKKSKGFFDDIDYNSTSLPILVKFLAKMILAGNVQLYNFNRDIRFSFGQTEIKRYKNVKNITTSAEISADDGSSGGIKSEVCTDNGYTIKDNQNIQLVAPNLYTKNSYTSYVNYQLISSSGDVSSTDVTKSNIESVYEYNFEIEDNDYTIRVDTSEENLSVSASRDTESIEIDYSESAGNIDCKFVDNNNTVTFTIEKSTTTQDGETIVDYNINSISWKYPEFTIKKDTYYQLKSHEKILINYTDSNKNVKFEWIPGNTIVKFTDSSDGVEELSTTPSTITKTYGGVEYKMSTLTATQQLDVLAINEIKFVDSAKLPIPQVPCLWFTNTVDKTTNAYILFNAGEDERLLEDNEYFIYTNQERNELVILGSGTLIKRSDNKPEIKHTISVSQSEISSDGLKALQDDDWYDFTQSRDGLLTIRELQIVTLGKNAGFRCDSIEKLTEDNTAKIDNKLRIVENPEYCENINAENKSWVALTTYNISSYDGEYIGWKVRSKLNLMMSSNHSQELKEGEKLNVKLPSVISTETGTIAWLFGGQLWSVPMSTQTEDDDSYKYLNFMFEGRSCSFTISKENYNNSNINGTFSDGTTTCTVEKGKFIYGNIERYINLRTTSRTSLDNTFDIDLSNTNILTNVIIGSAGGENLDVQSSGEAGIDLYTYTKAALPSYTSDGVKYQLAVNEKTNEIDIDFDFYKSVMSQEGADENTFSLPFSYKGLISSVDTVTKDEIVTSIDKQFIIPVTLNAINTESLKITAGTNNEVTLTPDSSVAYVVFNQKSDNLFNGLTISSWNLKTSSLERTQLITNDINADDDYDGSFDVEGSTYNYRINTKTKELTIKEGTNNYTYQKGAFIKIKDVWHQYIVDDATNTYYLLSCNVKDLLTVGEIFVIDDAQERFSNQVQKTLEILAPNYAIHLSKLSERLENEVNNSKWKFNKTYIVPEEDKIDTSTTDESNTDYLFSSTAVFDSHHIMNKYLIPQLITSSETSIKVAPQSINK